MPNKQINILAGDYSMHRLAPDAYVPDALQTAVPCWIGRTEDELSIVCESRLPLNADTTEGGWRCLQVEGPIAFSVVGVIAEIATLMANAGISLVSLSTYDTDYFLVKSEVLDRSLEALRASDWTVCI